MKNLNYPLRISVVAIVLATGTILTFFDGSQAKDKRPDTYLGGPSGKKSSEKIGAKIGTIGRHITSKARAPIPEEVTNEMQARAISRDAAIVIAQTHLIDYIQREETSSGMDVKTAEGVYIELKESVRGLVKGAEIRSTRWKDGYCWVKIAIKDKDLKAILKKF